MNLLMLNILKLALIFFHLIFYSEHYNFVMLFDRRFFFWIFFYIIKITK